MVHPCCRICGLSQLLKAEESPDSIWIAQGVTPLHRKVRNSGTERMSRALILKAGTGAFLGVAGVKTAKLCVKQDQIGKRFKCGRTKLSG